MYEWQQLIQTVVNEMDDAIMRRDDQALTLRALAARLHYSEYHATHKFREIAGMSLRTYLHQRRLAFALKEVRDTDRPLLDIALDYGFSGQEAFTRAFKALYGVTPGVYRRRPRPEQAADGGAVTAGNILLLFPEIPVAVGFIVAKVQVFVGGNSNKIRLDALFTFDHTDLSQSKDIAIEGMDAGAEHYGAGPAAFQS